MVVGDMRTGGCCVDLGLQRDNSVVFWSRFEAEKHLRSVGSPQRRLFSTSEHRRGKRRRRKAEGGKVGGGVLMEVGMKIKRENGGGPIEQQGSTLMTEMPIRVRRGKMKQKSCCKKGSGGGQRIPYSYRGDDDWSNLGLLPGGYAEVKSMEE
ncbi:unnamed protein product [Lactuca virosa]|uniref:Uncharacterized protein n=1 Tax=Lactuca virosa TaxID=75947 RepID=A0AAU9NEW2_9ASTR|nr:unnamed protein product [Lactuca virosa]